MPVTAGCFRGDVTLDIPAVEMAREVEASESPKAFDKAFKRVTGTSAPRSRPSGKRASS
jgi:hypothetical protein